MSESFGFDLPCNLVSKAKDLDFSAGRGKTLYAILLLGACRLEHLDREHC
jgi:hypothetical protein